jgi:hypothetical protein
MSLGTSAELRDAQRNTNSTELDAPFLRESPQNQILGLLPLAIRDHRSPEMAAKLIHGTMLLTEEAFPDHRHQESGDQHSGDT